MDMSHFGVCWELPEPQEGGLRTHPYEDKCERSVGGDHGQARRTGSVDSVYANARNNHGRDVPHHIG